MAAEPAGSARSVVADAKAASTSVVRRATLIVHDLDASRRFYRDVLGFEVWLENNGKVTADSLPSEAPLGAPSRFLIMKGKHPWIGMIGLLEFTAPRLPAPPRRERLGIGDIVFVMQGDDVEGVHARAVAQGARIHAPPHRFEVTGADGSHLVMSSLSLWDPDDYFIEYNQRLSVIPGKSNQGAP